MARYFLQLRSGIDELLDPDGSEFLTLEAVRAAVLDNARDVIKGTVDQGRIDLSFRIDAENEAGEVVYSLAFADAVDLVSSGRPA